MSASSPPDKASLDPTSGTLPLAAEETTERSVSDMPSGAEPTGPPRTDDIVVDAALADLAAADPADLDAQLTAGEQVQRTLQGRLGDLGG